MVVALFNIYFLDKIDWLIDCFITISTQRRRLYIVTKYEIKLGKDNLAIRRQEG